MSVYFSFSLTCILSVRGMHTADVMESFLISLSMRKIKIVLLCPREIVKAFKKIENREQKGMSGMYTTVLLADSMTPLWMCDFLKTLFLKELSFSVRHWIRVFFPYINRFSNSTKSCSVNSKPSLHSICFVHFYWRFSARRISVVTLYGCQWNDQNSSF